MLFDLEVISLFISALIFVLLIDYGTISHVRQKFKFLLLVMRKFIAAILGINYAFLKQFA